MRKRQLPPVKEPMYNGENLNPIWLRWFQEISRNQDSYIKPPDLIYSADVTLTTNDFGKTVLIDTSDSEVTCKLMTVSSKDVYCWLTIFRRGANRLTIIPDALTKIEYGSPGGRMWNDEKLRAAANVSLQLVTSTQWGITGATGVWKVA